MVNIAHYYGNGNKNNEISPHTGQNGIIKKSTKKKKKTNAGVGMEKRECSCTVFGNVNWYSHYGRQYGDFLKKKKTRSKTTIWPSNPTPRHKSRRNQNWKNTCIPLLFATLFTTAGTWKQPRCPLIDEWIKKLWFICTMKYYSALKRNEFESVLMRWIYLEPIIQR